MFRFARMARFGVGVLALVLVAGACGDGDDTTGGVQASNAWARTSPMMADAGAAYMALSADEATSIVSASVPVDIAARVELHETVPVEGDDAMGDDMDDSTDSAEEGDDSDVGDAMGDMAMTMQQVTSIDIPAGGEAVLEPGGLHIMLLELAAPLEEGETFEITLVTADGTEVVVPVEVRTDAP